MDNCTVVAETKVAKPLLKDAACANAAQLGCSDGTCLPNEYFCKPFFIKFRNNLI